MSKKHPPSRPHEDVMVDVIRDDPEFAIVLLNEVLRDGDSAELLTLLRRLTKAFGGVQEVAARAELNPKSLYRSLSGKGNPEFRSLTRVLEGPGKFVFCPNSRHTSVRFSSHLLEEIRTLPLYYPLCQYVHFSKK